jgi:predicted extracellular nuclease
MSNRSSQKSVFTHEARQPKRFNTRRSAQSVFVAAAGQSRLSRRLRQLGHTRTVIAALIVFTLFTSIFVWREVFAANILWSSAAGSAWLTAGNWTGGAVPTGTDVAQFGVNPTAATGVGINFNNTTNAGVQTNGQRIEEVAAVEITSARAAAFLIGDSSTTAGATGMFRLNGATVNAVTHVILRNNSSQLFTIQNTQGTGTQTMSVLLNDATDNLINIDGTGGITISSVIKDAGGSHITLGGAGSGALTLSGLNTYSGGTTIGSSRVIGNANGALGAGNVTVNTTGLGLTLQGAFNNLIADSATVNIATGASVALNQTGGSDTIGGLVLGGVTQTTPGTYGSTASGATNPNDTFFTGTGTLTLGGAPTLSINDVSQAEGNAGTTNFNFTVSLTQPAGAGGVSFTVNTADGTATTANSDYVAIVNGAGSIAQGNSSTTVTVQVNGDGATEPNETFFVNLSNITGATAGDTQGQGTITNDDFSLTPIHTIQGNGTASPIAGAAVTTSGIVTGLRSNGFFIQEPDATVDADPNTSEGIFVFTSSAPPAAAAIGNSVAVGGTVQEFIPSADTYSPPATELITPTVNLLSTGNALPVPITITASETTQPSETTNPLDSLEEYEGMRVTVPSLTVTGPTQGTITEAAATVSSSGVFLGVVTGVARPFREAGIAISDPLPTGAPGTVPRFDENPERIRVDSDAQPGTTALDVNAGTVVTNLTGPLDFAFRAYTIVPDAATPPTVGAQPGSVPVPTPTADELTVASFNMERFFDTNNDPGSDPVLTAAAFNRRVAKASLIIRTVEKLPDVIGVEEMENLTTLQAVATQVNNDVVGGGGSNPNYVAYLVEGNDVGGIDVGFLVKQSRITTYSVTQLELAGCDHVTPSTCYNYTDPNTGGLDILNDRPPLVLIASIPRTGGGLLGFTVIVNHLRSLNSIDDNTVAGSGTVGARVREKRRQQAEFLANYIQGRQTANPNEKIITVGDMNAFRVNDGYVDSIGTILGTPAAASQVTLASADLVNPNQTDLVDTLPADQQYSYNFDGNAQTLDHIIVSPPALAILSRFAYARNDSDFAVKNYESTNELRISDHDQPVAYFSLLAPTAANGVISGQIRDAGGVPVAGAVVNLSGTQNRKFITDRNGNYRFDNVETTGFYTVRPSRVDFTFSPAERSFSQVGNNTEAAFTGSALPNAVSPLDTPEYFVRQQYLDFLGREPDESGFNFWSDQLLDCGSDLGCVEQKRINVSAAYFLSIEFQATGGLVDSLYRASYGRAPRYAEFLPDAASVANGVIVGRPDWSAKLAANKQAFIDAWVQRADFRSAYDGLSDGQYVETLLGHTGVKFSDSERAAFVNSLTSGSTTRTELLKTIAEDSRFVNAKRNEMFVMMEYFGYLRREPDALGFQFWLDKLNGFGGNFERAEMVKAFLLSSEYRERFAR